MEIFLLFALFSVFVLGILSLIVLEYQNQRAKQWHQSLSLTSPTSHPNDAPQEVQEPEAQTPITVPTPQTIDNFNPKNDAVLTSV